MSYSFLGKKQLPVQKPKQESTQKNLKMKDVIANLIAQLNVPATGGERQDPITGKVITLPPPSQMFLDLMSAVFQEVISNPSIYLTRANEVNVEKITEIVRTYSNLYVQIAGQIIIVKETEIIPDLLKQLEENK